MIAVIKTGGKQYKIKEGDLLKVEKIDSAGVGKNIILKEVLLVSEEDGKNLKVGTPYVASAIVGLVAIIISLILFFSTLFNNSAKRICSGPIPSGWLINPPKT